MKYTEVKTIEVNNQRTIELQLDDRGLMITNKDSHGEIERRDLITEGELVMLFNLYRRLEVGEDACILGETANKVLKETYAEDDVSRFMIKDRW